MQTHFALPSGSWSDIRAWLARLVKLDVVQLWIQDDLNGGQVVAVYPNGEQLAVDPPFAVTFMHTELSGYIRLNKQDALMALAAENN